MMLTEQTVHPQTLEQPWASTPLPPVVNELPRNTKRIQWDELDGEPALTQHADAEAAPPSETLDLRVELGRTRIDWDEIDKLREGTLLPLDNAAAEPVDIYAGGHLIARGEVLALDGSLGIRVVEVLS